MTTQKGDSWNESEAYADPLSGRRIQRLTSAGFYNMTPNYHTGTAFTADGRSLILASGRQQGSALFKAEVETGRLTQLTGWFPDYGSIDEIHKHGQGRCILGGKGGGVTMLSCVAPHRRFAVFVLGRAVRLVDIETLAERVLCPDVGTEWIPGMPSISPDEETLLIPLMSSHPEIAAGQPITRSYMEHFAEAGPQFRLLEIEVSTATARVVYQEKCGGCAHSPHSPADAGRVLLDRDRSPGLWAYGPPGVSRAWTLNLRDGGLTALTPRNAQTFQTHSVWTHDGEAILYHGPAAGGGQFIGAISPAGQVLKEYVFPEAKGYGHVAALAGRKGIILDGDLAKDRLQLLDFETAGPCVETLALHGSDLGCMPWQYAHVHPQSDWQGRRVSFNRAVGGRSDVLVVDV
ncbi:MAG: hypothetical protein WC205_15980 [Opitutaceae bacterium]|jgi:hypothetical protein